MIISIDLALVSLVLLLTALGTWIKEKVSKWIIPLPGILLILSCLYCTVWGWVISDCKTAEEMLKSFLSYGAFNGIFYCWLTIWLYDMVHAWKKGENYFLKAWGFIKRIFVKKEAENVKA